MNTHLITKSSSVNPSQTICAHGPEDEVKIMFKEMIANYVNHDWEIVSFTKHEDGSQVITFGKDEKDFGWVEVEIEFRHKQRGETA